MSDAGLQFNMRLWETWEQLNPSLQSTISLMPAVITGQLFNIDHSPAAHVLVIARRPSYGKETDNPQGFDDMSVIPWPRPSALTDERGAFALALPSFPLPERMFFDVLARDEPVISFSVCGPECADGLLGPIVLNANLTPFSGPEVRKMRSASSMSMFDQFHRAIESASSQQTLQLGENDCAEQFYTQAAPLEEFPFGIVYRLVEPTVAPISLFTVAAAPLPPTVPSTAPAVSREVLPKDHGEFNAILDELAKKALSFIPGASFVAGVAPEAVTKAITLLEDAAKDAVSAIGQKLASAEAKITSTQIKEASTRRDIDVPIDIGAFKQQLAGISKQPLTIAGSLGLAYILQCKQVWRQGGLTLGDLLYSLPLAPGESQLIAVREIQQSSSFREQEGIQDSESQQSSSVNDSSSTAIFNAAFNESANQASQYTGTTRTVARGGSSSPGFMGGLFGGSSSASSSGETTTAGSVGAQQNLSRDFASAAAQRLSASVSRAASAVRNSSRTLIRIATQDEKQSIVTKSIANYNHCHALTIQYWEVLRQISIQTEVSGLQLVCLLPLSLVTFMAEDQPTELPFLQDGTAAPADPATFYTLLLKRYEELIQYLDAIAAITPDVRQYRNAIDILRHLRLEPPTAENALPQDDRTLTISISGGFIPQDQVSVNVTYRVNPADKSDRVISSELFLRVPPRTEFDQLSTRQDFLEALRQVRHTPSQNTIPDVKLRMPAGVSYHQLSALVVTIRPVESLEVRLKSDIPPQNLAPLKLDAESLKYFAGLTQTITKDDIVKAQCGDPVLFSAQVSVNVKGNSYPIATVYSTPGGPGLPLPITNTATVPLDASAVPVAVSKDDLKDVEALYRYVKTNRVRYSRAVWESLTPDEWAILLERYAIRFTNHPPGSSNKGNEVKCIPLLNCVANQLLGIEGNMAIFPITLPVRQLREQHEDKAATPSLPDNAYLTHTNLTNLLLKRHMYDFRTAPSVVTLPTHGMLGEGVLGKCNSCEKIDLTRFWNWKDSPIPNSPTAISGSLFGSPKDSLPAAAQTTSGPPGQPSALPSIISINSGGDAPAATSLISDLMAKATGLTDSKTADNPTLKALQDLVGQTESRTMDRAKDAMTTSKELSNKAMDVFQAVATLAIQSGEKASESAGTAAPAAAAVV